MQWLVDHPEFISNPFYVGGDSYAGIPVSIVTQLISNGIDFQLSRNEDWLSAYNLKFSTRLGKCFALVCNYSNFQLTLVLLLFSYTSRRYCYKKNGGFRIWLLLPLFPSLICIILKEKWNKCPVLDCINLKFVVLSNVGNEAGIEPRINLKVCTFIMRKGKNVICFKNCVQYIFLWFGSVIFCSHRMASGICIRKSIDYWRRSWISNPVCSWNGVNFWWTLRGVFLVFEYLPYSELFPSFPCHPTLY